MQLGKGATYELQKRDYPRSEARVEEAPIADQRMRLE